MAVDAMDPSVTAEGLASLAENLIAAKMYSLASCIMLFYDIVITFEDEVDTIWNQPRYSYMTVLWVLNRYLSPLGYIIVIASFHMNWSPSVCDRYILFPEALKIVTSSIIGAIFVLRLYAIYGKNAFIAFFGVVVLIAHLGVKIWAFTDGTRLSLPEGLVGCILVGKHQGRFVFTWIAELVFDAVIFLLTFWCTIVVHRVQHTRPESILALIMRDGITYFAVIFAANVVTVSIFLGAPPDIKAINASFSTLITSLMVSRIILNLRSAGQARPIVWGASSVGPTSTGFNQHDAEEVAANTMQPQSLKFHSETYRPNMVASLFVIRRDSISRVTSSKRTLAKPDSEGLC